MANMRAIRTRIKSVKNTEQITKAMKMVAVSKLRRTQSSMQAMRPFSEKSQEVMDTLLSASSGLENRFIKPHKEVKKVCYVLFWAIVDSAERTTARYCTMQIRSSSRPVRNMALLSAAAGARMFLQTASSML